MRGSLVGISAEALEESDYRRLIDAGFGSLVVDPVMIAKWRSSAETRWHRGAQDQIAAACRSYSGGPSLSETHLEDYKILRL